VTGIHSSNNLRQSSRNFQKTSLQKPLNAEFAEKNKTKIGNKQVVFRINSQENLRVISGLGVKKVRDTFFQWTLKKLVKIRGDWWIKRF